MTDNMKQFLEADALRTQGEWIKGCYNGQCHKKHKHKGKTGDDPCIYEYTLDESPCVSIAPNITLIGWDDYGTVLGDDDANFIAAASRIAPDIRQLLAAFEQVCDALESVDGHGLARTSPMREEQRQQALTAAAPWRKLMGGV